MSAVFLLEEQRNQILDCIDRIGTVTDFCFIPPQSTTTHEWIWSNLKAQEFDWRGAIGNIQDKEFQLTFFCFLLAMNSTGDFNP